MSPNESFLAQETFRFLGTLAGGERVFDRPRSHLKSGADLERYLPLALSRIVPEGRAFLVETVSFDEPIGKSDCIPTEPSDKIVYAQRPGRPGLSRFVVGKEPLPTKDLTVVLKKIEGGYLVITAYLGPEAGPEPWDERRTTKSIEFWKTHALVWGSLETVPGTQRDAPPVS